MQALYDDLIRFLLSNTLKAILLVLFGYVLARLLSALVGKSLHKYLTLHQKILTTRLIFYIILALFGISAFQELGFHLSILIGATGILTIAIGIASQTSISNIVSGIFIIAEKPFRIGDFIQVSGMQGEVMVIGFLSVKIRTSENTMVRIPNETLVKSAIVNTSYFPLRRIELNMSISYKDDIDKIKDILLDIAERNTVCLTEPSPSFTILNFGDSAVQTQFSIWTKREDYAELKSKIQEEIKKAFMEMGIKIPFPSRMVYVYNKDNCRDS